MSRGAVVRVPGGRRPGVGLSGVARMLALVVAGLFGLTQLLGFSSEASPLVTGPSGLILLAGGVLYPYPQPPYPAPGRPPASWAPLGWGPPDRQPEHKP